MSFIFNFFYRSESANITKGFLFMYIEELHYINVGPIERIDLQLMSPTDQNPKPIVFVGKNGSGKSILLSNIVDAFYEIAAKHYRNAIIPLENMGHQYYKTIMPKQIRLGKNEMFSHIKFKQEDQPFEYLCKSGICSKEDYISRYGNSISADFNWDDEKNPNYKYTNIRNEQVENAFENDVVCYYPPDRYAKPDWLGEMYYGEIEDISERKIFTHDQKLYSVLRNPITSRPNPEILLQWLLNIIADTRVEQEVFELYRNLFEKSRTTEPSLVFPLAANFSRKNVETILSEILRERVVLRMGDRSSGSSRFQILSEKYRKVLVPSLDSLSTGEFALFNIFATIVRYADSISNANSVTLGNIKGVVVIDEIELHLHTQLQRVVLPKLIKLFPKVQFIITSHAPLFLLGMQETFGDDGFDIYEMPEGNKITAEQFSEFDNAYDYYQKTSRYQKEIKNAIDSHSNLPLIVTEGSTDWRHMEAAREALSTHPECADWLPNLQFEFLEYDPPNKNSALPKLHMNNSELEKMCSTLSNIPQPRKTLFIADRDVPNIVNKLNGDRGYKNWGNNVFSFCLPIPEFRTATPEICIEHYYKDDELKRTIDIDGIPRRIYMGNEFDEFGRGLTDEKTYTGNTKNCCGIGKINIIDGNDNNRVVDTKPGNNTNYALPKSVFAEKVLNKEESFTNMDFTGFIPLFKLIRDILETA